MKKEQKPRTILFLSSWFPSKEHPFNGNFVFKHAEAISTYNKVIFYNISSDSIDNYDNLITEQNNNLIVINEKLDSKIKFKLLHQLYIIYRYLKAFHTISTQYDTPSLTHINVILFTGFIGLLYKIIYRTPYVITEHWTGLMEDKSSQLPFIHKKLVQLIIKKSAFVCPVSDNLTRSIQKIAPNGKYQTIPNVVDTKLYTNIKKEESNKFRFVHISSLLEEQKNISGILSAIKQLIEINSKFEFHFISCSSTEPFKNKSSNMGLKENVFFHESFSPQQVAEFLSTCNCFVLFSHYETFGVVIIEAFSAGLPVITTQAGAAGDLINSYNGIVIPENNINTLTKIMASVLNKEKHFDSDKIKEFAFNNFSYQKVGEAYNNIYNQILNQ